MNTKINSVNYMTARDYNPALHGAFAAIARAKLVGKEYSKSRPKTAMRLMIDDDHILTVKPIVKPSPTGWTVGDVIRVELRQVVTVQGVKGNGCEMILELMPGGKIRPRRWWKKFDRTKRAFDLIADYLDMLGSDPEQAISRNKNRCAICGRKLTDADSMARGIGPECQKYFCLVLHYTNGAVIYE